METGGLGIPYFVNPGEFSNHPVIGAEMAKEGIKPGRIVEEPPSNDELNGREKSQINTKKVVKGKAKKRGPALNKFESTVERVYTTDLYAQCQRGVDRKQRARDAELGLFGIGVDWEKIRKLESEVVPSCEELKRLGLLR